MREPAADSLRILFVTPYIPSAIRVRSFQLIRSLVRAGHRVTVVALEDRSPADKTALMELRASCEAVHVVSHSRIRAAMQALAALPTPTPLWAAWCRSPKLLRLVRSLAASGAFDVAHIEHLRAAQCAPALGNLPCLFDSVDCITDLQRQIAAQTRPANPRHWLAREEAAKLRRYEPRVCSGFRQVVVTSPYDADALISLGVQSPIAVIPNGVSAGEIISSANKTGTVKRFDLIFSGKMRYQANEDAALFLLSEILPHLETMLSSAPPVTVCLAGAGPSERLRRAASRWGERVTVTGWVEDLCPYFAASRIAVCPLRIGVGIQNKALEAMAMALPVVATPLAARAFDQNAEPTGLRIAADAEEFAHHCAHWLTNNDDAHHAGEAGQGYVRRFHRWETASEAFVKQYRRVLSL